MSSHAPLSGSGEGPTPTEVEALRAELHEALAGIDARDRQAQAQREREQMLRGELQHRARNLLALVRSIFTRTVETGVSLEEVARHFQGRLDVIARYQPPGSPRHDLERLVRDELREFRFGYGDGITIEGPETWLAPPEVLPVALALHELVTNALKFGALSAPGGRLDVRWSADAHGLVLNWTESGAAPDAAAPHRGFGQGYIEDGLPFQIDAHTEFALHPDGARCTIRLPARPAS
jgi:two-component sensor histidine kinase